MARSSQQARDVRGRWVVRDVSEKTIERLKVYAVGNGISLAKVLELAADKLEGRRENVRQ